MALCRPPGPNHACSPRQSAKKPSRRTSWCDFLRFFILQNNFYENYVKLSKFQEFSQDFKKFHQLSPAEQNDSNSYGILGVLGSGNVKMLNFTHFHNLHKRSISSPKK